MKTIQINKNTFDVTLIPDHLHATPRPWLFTKQVESIPTVPQGKRLKWVPDDPEKPEGAGALELVDAPKRPSPLDNYTEEIDAFVAALQAADITEPPVNMPAAIQEFKDRVETAPSEEQTEMMMVVMELLAAFSALPRPWEEVRDYLLEQEQEE